MKLMFGKHKGKELSDVPEDYLIWILQNLTHLNPSVRQAIERHLLNFKPKPDPEPKPAPNLGEMFSSIAKDWYRQMAKRHHPDQGGDERSMIVVNDGYERISDMIGKWKSL